MRAKALCVITDVMCSDRWAKVARYSVEFWHYMKPNNTLWLQAQV